MPVKLEDYRLVFIAVGLVGVLLFSSPSIGLAFHLPGGEQFSELYLLGPGHMAEDYPFNVAVGGNYSVYVGVGNHLGSSAYYALYVKFGNQTDPLPNATAGLPSSLSPLFEYRFFVQDGESWERLLTFSVFDASVVGNESMIRKLMINGVSFNLAKSASWDSNSTMFSYKLFFELWLYDEASNSMQFHNRFVTLNLNLTGSA